MNFNNIIMEYGMQFDSLVITLVSVPVYLHVRVHTKYVRIVWGRLCIVYYEACSLYPARAYLS